MRPDEELWLLEEVPTDEPSELLQVLPEIRQRLAPDATEGELGIRAILDRPEVLSRAWRRHARRPRESHGRRARGVSRRDARRAA